MAAIELKIDKETQEDPLALTEWLEERKLTHIPTKKGTWEFSRFDTLECCFIGNRYLGVRMRIMEINVDHIVVANNNLHKDAMKFITKKKT